MSDELTPGKELGSYRIVKLLGEGGMGRVYVAEHMRLGRRVALKMLRQEFAVNPVAVSRFFAEARAVNRISHEHLVEITDFFEKPGGENYFIMELLKGEDLGKHLLRSGALPVARAIDIAHQTASVLAAVHAAHIVHRDLKPDNIFLVERASRPDFVKLLDFGVAKLSDTYDGIKMKTTTAGAVIGTPEYMSPEQAGGLPVDQRTDIYALGVIMYEVLSGRLPFEAKSFGEMVIKHMTVAPRPLAEHELKESIPAALESLVMALLEKDPDHRPQTMAEVEEVLQGLVDYVVPAETRVTGQMPVLRRPTKPGLDASDRSQRIPVVSITGREPTVEIAPSTSGAIPAAGLAAASGPIPVVAAETATAIKRRPVRLLAIVGCAMAVAALVTWLAMRDGGYEAEPSTNATITPARPEPAAAKPAPAPAPVPAPITAVAPPVALPVSEPVAATPPPPPPPPASPAKAVASRPPAPSRTAPTPPPHKAAQKSQPTPQVDRSGTMDVFGDN